MNITENKIINSYNNYRIFWHILFWSFYIAYGLFYCLFSSGFGSIDTFVAVFLIDFFTIYVLLLFLIPRYLIKRIKTLKFIYLFAVVVLTNFSLNFLLQYFIVKSISLNITEILVTMSYCLQHSLVFIILACGIKMFKYYILISQKVDNLENEKIQSELEYLKLQLNPHFLFNTLNNIHTLTRIKPELASDTLIKLSDLLRYQIYECSDSKVFVKSEFDYLINYLDLQKVRFENLEVIYEKDGNLSSYMVYPFIFIPFVENAVKHGVDNKRKNNIIKLFLGIDNNKLKFSIENSKISSNLQKNSKGGIGLKNVKRRLELLYPGRYSLRITENEDLYNVKLEIKLK